MHNYFCIPPIWTQQNMEYTPSYWNDINYAHIHQKDVQIASLKQKIEYLSLENKELKEQINNQILKSKKNKKKTIKRRTEDQLRKCFACPYQKCKKQYASSLALNLHIKIKHNGGTKKQRDLAAKKIIQAQKAGNIAELNNINLPPNYINKFKKSNNVKRRSRQQKKENNKQINYQNNQE